jgi:hypothetical protein
MFGNWLKGVEKKYKVQIRTGICALMWLFGTVVTILFLTKVDQQHMQVVRSVGSRG